MKLHLKIDKFDLERDQLNPKMFVPATQILYDEKNTFTELIFSMNSLRLREFKGDSNIRKPMIPNFVKGFLLL